FLRKHNRKYNSEMNAIDSRVMHWILEYDWPGNIRELENVIKRLVILGKEDLIVDELTNKIESRRKVEKPQSTSSIPETLSEDTSTLNLKSMSKSLTSSAEKEAILRALQQTQWNRKQAAVMLNVSYKTLLNKIRKLDIK